MHVTEIELKFEKSAIKAHTLFIIITLLYSLVTIEEFLMHPFSISASLFSQLANLYQKFIYSLAI